MLLCALHVQEKENAELTQSARRFESSSSVAFHEKG